MDQSSEIPDSSPTHRARRYLPASSDKERWNRKYAQKWEEINYALCPGTRLEAPRSKPQYSIIGGVPILNQQNFTSDYVREVGRK